MANHQTRILVFVIGLLSSHPHLSRGEVDLSVGMPIESSVSPLGLEMLTVTNLPDDASFVVVQVHAQRHNLTLSMSSSFVLGQTVSGRSVGVLSTSLGATAQFYLRSDVNDTIRFLAYAQSYTQNDPMPGGCNQVFPLENDPNLHLRDDKDLTEVLFQWSDTEAGTGGCEESKNQSDLTYELYVAYSPSVDIDEDAFFSTVRRMLTAEDIMKNGRKVASFADRNHPMQHVSTTKGTGTVYALVVKQVIGDVVAFASYVPVTTYSCSFQANDSSSDSCEFLASNYDTLTFVTAVFFGLLGLAVCLLGHYFLRLGLFMSAMWLTCVAIAAGVSHLTFTYPVYQVLVLPVGVVSGILWVMQWHWLQKPILAVLPAMLLLGILLDAVLYYTPFGNVSYFTRPSTFPLMSVVVIVLMLSLSLFCTREMNILSLALVGSFMVMMTIDISVRGSFHYVFYNYFRRIAVPGFLGAITIAPIQGKDIGLMGGWVSLFIVGVVVQFLMVRKKPHFPLRRHCRQNLMERISRGTSYGAVEDRNGRERIPGAHTAEDVRIYDERAPLLPDYGGIPEVSHRAGSQAPPVRRVTAAGLGSPGVARSSELESVASTQ